MALVAPSRQPQTVLHTMGALRPLMGEGIEFGKFDWTDPFNLNSQLTEEELLISQSTREYCQKKLFPRVLEDFRHESRSD